MSHRYPVLEKKTVQKKYAKNVETGKSLERNYLKSRNHVADPEPGSGAFLTPGSGIRDG
jgi:hypothetical protein